VARAKLSDALLGIRVGCSDDFIRDSQFVGKQPRLPSPSTSGGAEPSGLRLTERFGGCRLDVMAQTCGCSHWRGI
jgi:hypothetical protein